jgi:hypothetical protein
MLSLLLMLAALAVPFVIYFVRQQQATVPSLRWPKLAAEIGLTYKPNPPSLSGQRGGRPVAAVLQGQGVLISMSLRKPTRLRLEVGPKDLVTKRAGIVVPDPVPTGDNAFDERLLVRCNDKAAGTKLMDSAVRQRIFALKDVDFIAQSGTIQWTVPELTDPDLLGELFEITAALAQELETYPA